VIAGIIAAIVVVILLIIIFVFMYNALVRLNVRSNEAWSDITVQLKRRADLIPNLVSTVKGYAKHESGVFENVTKSRATMLDTNSPKEAGKAENQFQQTMKSLFAVAENYPDLKASQNFQELQAELTDTEDKIQASRRFYNTMVREFNAKRQTIPTSLIASMAGFKANKEYFEVDEAQLAQIQSPVEVKF
jgi:LemA protein